jgi:hypothetical protein
MTTTTKRLSKSEQLARWFARRPGQWVSVLDLVRVVPVGWHREVYRCRHSLGLNIENRETTRGGQKISEYRYTGPAA